MYRLLLIDMPFGEIKWPSLALTQLQAVVKEELGDYIDTQIIYANHDFANLFGLKEYQLISGGPSIGNVDLSENQIHSGIGDWIFRAAAFPEWEDNSEEYFRQFFRKSEKFKHHILSRREEIPYFFEHIVTKYEMDKANIVGFTSMFQQHFASFALAKRLKEINPDIITVMGGASFDYSVAKIVANQIEYIDYAFYGSSLISFPKFLHCFVNNELERVESISGICSRKFIYSDSNILEKCSYSEERDINHIVSLDYDSFFSSLYQVFGEGVIEPELYFETSRGCWWGEKVKCTFCDYNGLNMKFRVMEPENAILYIQSLLRYADKCKLFRAVDSILSKEYYRSVLPYIEVPEGTAIFFEVKVGMCDDEFEALAKASVLYVQAGIESLNSTNLKCMKKGTNVFDNIYFLMQCAKYGIIVLWNLLAGIVGEDESIYNTYLEDIPLLFHLNPPTGFWPISYDKNCDYTTKSSHYGLNLEPDISVNKYLYQLEEKLLKEMAYFFTDINRKNIFTPKKMKKIHLINEKIKIWINRWKDSNNLPQLYFYRKANNFYIMDTRLEDKKQYVMEELDFRILTYCNKQSSMEKLISAFQNLDKAILEEKLCLYLKYKLLFVEGTQFISLVFPQKPAFPEQAALLYKKIPTHMEVLD